MHERLREWVAAAPESFARGRVHEENLRYLLGEDFSIPDAWKQAVEAFRWVIGNLPAGERLIVRAVVPLSDADQLVPRPIEPTAIADEVSATTPPMLVLLTPALAIDRRAFEEYRVTLELDLDAMATYVVARSLDWPHEGSWTRSVILERSAGNALP